jgi:hypothetical protein
MRATLVSTLFAVFLVSGAAAPAAETGPEAMAARWAPLSFLIGDWEGAGSGKPGESVGRFNLKPDLQGHVLVRRSTADTQNGHHEDLMVIYPSEHGFRAVYLDNEDHVINYAVTATDSPKSAVFLSDEVPGAPRFRLTYRANADGSVGVVFDIASPVSKEFKTYTQGVVRKSTPPALR